MLCLGFALSSVCLSRVCLSRVCLSMVCYVYRWSDYGWLWHCFIWNKILLNLLFFQRWQHVRRTFWREWLPVFYRMPYRNDSSMSWIIYINQSSSTEEKSTIQKLNLHRRIQLGEKTVFSTEEKSTESRNQNWKMKP